jgi:hypothetical protein
MCAKYGLLAAICALGVAATSLRADEAKPAADAIRSAIDRALPLLEKGAEGSAEQRQCFTCHNQALPVFALAEARKRGFAIDEDNFERQLRHTEAHLERGRRGYLAGRGQGGQAITAGYALWTLEAGGRTGDETTAAVTHYLLEYQKQQGRWSHPGHRPPSSGSDFTTTYVALRGLAAFGTDEQRDRIDERTNAVRQWLLDTEPRDNEDRVFRLRALPYVGADADAVRNATRDLIERQRDDGGWAQTDEMQSDAYATATALVAMLRDGGLGPDHPAVITRAEAFQTYFESGYPHGKDQFISISAASWATVALLLTLPASP